ncbi:MAG: hypothetical protein IJV22_08710 [Bacteroidales bacterium]|nr:hypothetical protein [Bacteroidales bacterium]
MHTTKISITMLLAVLLVVGCTKDKVQVRFASDLEQPQAEEADTVVAKSGAKTYLTNAEQWIYWEDDDAVQVFPAGEEGVLLKLITGSGTRNAFFDGTVLASKEYYAVYPATSQVSGQTGSEVFSILYPAEQQYRQGDSPCDADKSFGRGCFPMVAWTSVGNWKATGENSERLDFHSVSGIVRIQVYAAKEAASAISKIEFREISDNAASYASTKQPKQISGKFSVKGIKTNAPYLQATMTGGAVTEEARKITITNIPTSRTIGGSDVSNLWTFYLALPVLDDTARVDYALQMKVFNADGSKTCTKNMKFYVARNRITKMQALCIDSWEQNILSPQFVGNGTAERPFQIYDTTDMVRLRNAFNNPVDGKVIINGQEVTKDTYFKVVRNDIVLYPGNWVDGIRDFKGHFTIATSNPRNHGITNISGYPIFYNITSEGEVSLVSIDQLPTDGSAPRGWPSSRPWDITTNRDNPTPTYVRMLNLVLSDDEEGRVVYYMYDKPDHSYALSMPGFAPAGVKGFSPLCYVNEGTLTDCHNRMNIALADVDGTTWKQASRSESFGLSLAGLAVVNNGGDIRGGACEGILSLGIFTSTTIGTTTYKHWTPLLEEGASRLQHAAGVCIINKGVGASMNGMQLSSEGVGGSVQGFTLTFATLNADSVAGLVFANYATVINCQGSYRTYQTPSNWGGITFYNYNKVENCNVTSMIWADTILNVDGQPVSKSNVGGITYFNRGTINHCRNNANLRARHTGGIAVRQDSPYAVIKNCWSSRDATVRGYDAVGGLVARLWAGRVENSYCLSTLERTGEVDALIGGIAAEVAYDYPNYVPVIRNCYNRFSSFYGGFVTVNETPVDGRWTNLIAGATRLDATSSVRSAESTGWYTNGTAAFKRFEENYFVVPGTLTSETGGTYSFVEGTTGPDRASKLIDGAQAGELLINALNSGKGSNDAWYLGSYTVDGTTHYDTIAMLEWQRNNSWDETHVPDLAKTRRMGGRRK